MGKFGKRVEVKNDLGRYVIGVVAEGGFGKTTLMKNVCEKEFGDEGYIIADMGLEDGTAALEGAIAEKIQSWDHYIQMVDDIVKNKDTDYPKLKCVVIDTLDAAFDLAETYSIKAYNREQTLSPKKGESLSPATTINQVDGGFGRGLDRTIGYVLDSIAKLASVGVTTFFTAHVKVKEMTDVMTGEVFDTLTANMTYRYFKSIFNIAHVVAFGYKDRNIEKVELAEKDVITKKNKTRNQISSEKRMLRFRSDSMIADAKSRFRGIVPEVELNTDAFIKAIKDAIMEEKNCNDGKETFETSKEDIGRSSVNGTTPGIVSKEKLNNTKDITEIDREKLIEDIRNCISGFNEEQKANLKNNISVELGISGQKMVDLPNDKLVALYNKLK